MNAPKRNWSSAGLILFAVTALILALYWSYLLHRSLQEQYAGDPRQLDGFLRWLMGYVFIFAGLGFLGWLNYRLPYRFLSAWPNRWIYRTWLLALLWVIFELLQWRTRRDIELVEENLLVAGLGTLVIAGLTLLFDAARARRERLELMQQKTAAELDNLKAQLNPHFLFNALNTLYSEAVQQKQERLAQLISELSGILRFALQQSRQEWIQVQEELDFLRRYIHLQEARLPDNPERVLDIHLDWDEQPARIAPLLLIPFVENAFQYGLHPTQSCFLRLRLEIENRRLQLRIENSVIRPKTRQGAGVGIANTRQRLERLYPGAHAFHLEESKDAFRVLLEIML